ncbi:MAG: fibronectin type III domain-containing protein, partial [Patescibacteria group bacterium]
IGPVTGGGDAQAPSVPAGFSAQAISSSQINLSWTASTDNVGVAGYRIYRCQGTGCTPTTQIATSATNSYSNTGLIASIVYVYRVSAYDAAGNVSGQSSSATATTQTAADTTPPASPTGLTVI